MNWPRMGKALAVAAALVALAPLPARAQNYLHTSGSKIVDSNGNVVRITGLNWFGLETSNYAPHGLWTRSMSSFLDQIKSLGYNCLRVPYCTELFDSGSTPTGIDYNQNPDLVGLNGLQILDKLVAGCRARGIKIFLDRHRPDSGAQSPLWYTTGEYTEQRWISDWQMLARHYLGNDTVIGCDLHNEPHNPATWGSGDMSTDWRLAAERCGNAILSVNPHLLIIVEGTDNFDNNGYWWGGELAGAGPYPVQLNVPNQLVYSAHDYPSSVANQPWFSDPTYPSNLPSIWDKNWGYLVKNNIAPVILGEFGSRLGTTSDQQWFSAICNYIQANNLSFTFWCLNPNSGDTGGLLEDDWQTVVAAKQQALQPLLAPFIGSSGGSTTGGGGGGTVPTAPTGLTATAGNAQVSLSWSASSGATGYNVYRSTSAGGEGSTPVASGVTSTSYTNTSLTNGTTYYYKVAAVNSAGTSGQSNEASATPAGSTGGSGPATASVNVPNGGPWYSEEDVILKNTAPITAMTITINIAITTGVSYNGQYNTVGGSINMSHSSTASTLSYQYSLASGQTLPAGSWTFAAQINGTGSTHPYTGDTYTVTYTSGGATYTLNGSM